MIIGILFTVITISLLGFAAYKSSRNKQNELADLVNSSKGNNVSGQVRRLKTAFFSDFNWGKTMTKLAVKDLKQIIDGNIEVYQPTEKINCTSTKANGKYYRYSTNADDKLVDFITTNDSIIKIYTEN